MGVVDAVPHDLAMGIELSTTDRISSSECRQLIPPKHVTNLGAILVSAPSGDFIFELGVVTPRFAIKGFWGGFPNVRKTRLAVGWEGFGWPVADNPMANVDVR
jgi:hypothetical protein